MILNNLLVVMGAEQAGGKRPQQGERECVSLERRRKDWRNQEEETSVGCPERQTVRRFAPRQRRERAILRDRSEKAWHTPGGRNQCWLCCSSPPEAQGEHVMYSPVIYCVAVKCALRVLSMSALCDRLNHGRFAR